MSRNKTVILLALAALLTLNPVVSAAETQNKEPQDIIDVTEFTSEEVTYETATVERGDIIDEANLIAHKYYALTYNLKFEQPDAKFLEYTVNKGEEVKKGDVVARFTIDRSEAEFTRLSLDLQRTKEQTADGISDREEAIANAREALAAAADDLEKEILSLTVQKLETELEQYKHRQQYSIDQKAKAYNEEYEQRTTDVLLSPVDGIVQSISAKKKVNDAVSPNETLVTIATGETVLWAVENDALRLRYNMPVEIKFGAAPNEVFLPGRVVAADDAIPAIERTGVALIELDPYDEEKYNLTGSLMVIADSVRLDDVLLVPRKAVIPEGDKFYVTKLHDGIMQKRYVNPSLNNFVSTYIIEGVEEGETLILN